MSWEAWITEPLRTLPEPRAAIYRARSIAAWVWPPWVSRKETAGHLEDVWSYLLDQQQATTTALERVWEATMASAAEYAQRIAVATDELADDLKSVRDRLVAVEQATDEDKQAAVDAALSELDQPIARLEALGREDDAPADVSADAPVEESPAPDAA